MNTASLQLDYVSSDELAARSATWWLTVLGVVGFEKPPLIDLAQVPITASMTPSLGAADNLCEVWRVAGGEDLRLSTGSRRHGRVHYRYCDELLFGSITVDEDAIDGTGSAVLLRATLGAYQEIFDVLKETRHRHLIRVWNYLPEINREADGDERYRHFNSARQTAFRNSGRSTVGTVPAASALGSPPGSPISIYFLASRHPPKMIENPR
ncbi:MAG: hypothetical protein JWN43_4289, partial [Gammaproteobacteria bacterium]|nr:hypothetical protein [Gammaproteobacteria bacterium]